MDYKNGIFVRNRLKCPFNGFFLDDLEQVYLQNHLTSCFLTNKAILRIRHEDSSISFLIVVHDLQCLHRAISVFFLLTCYLRNLPHILLLISSKIKGINQIPFPLQLSENCRYSDIFRGSRR